LQWNKFKWNRIFLWSWCIINIINRDLRHECNYARINNKFSEATNKFKQNIFEHGYSWYEKPNNFFAVWSHRNFEYFERIFWIISIILEIFFIQSKLIFIIKINKKLKIIFVERGTENIIRTKL
jgi:hypothetical protein